MIAFITGIAIETYGFYLRVRITGWAPVTSMEETVIWVALIASVIGLVLEVISRKTYPALAASGVALLTTVLAANVPLLDPKIKALQPVLRSNYWLTIHVLTIVSSYAAFALAMGLGMLAVGFYLTAYYRRSASFKELAVPLVPGLPLLVAGAVGAIRFLPRLGAGAARITRRSIYLVAGVAAVGGVLSIASLYGLFGELANRSPLKAGALGVALLVAGVVGFVEAIPGYGPLWYVGTGAAYAGSIATLVGLSVAVLALFGFLANETMKTSLAEVQALDESAISASLPETSEASSASAAGVVAAGNGNGGVATVTRPTVAAIRATQAANRPKYDARTLSMQAVASFIKPLSNFLYRAMQVGVLLVAAGTILGGVWADYSWGRFWGWDPKEVWALITLLVYLVPLHGRFAGWVNTFGLVCASVVCFLSVMMAWYGVNFVLGVGLHSYGFTEGGGQGIVGASCLGVLSIVAGAGWRRYLSYREEPILA